VFAGWQERRQIFRDELGAGDNDILVGIVGRLTEIKNHELFLRAAALYVGAHLGVRPDSNTDQPAKRVRFVIIGDGHRRENLEQQSQVLGLSELLVFTGMRKDPEVFYPALDIVALTSRNEGTPLTLIEAMLNARPVIATAVGGVIDLLGNAVSTVTESGAFKICERGISVQPGDASGFADGLARLINDEELRRTTGEMGRQFIEQQYAKERLLADIGSLYQELLKRTPVVVNVRQTSVCR